jgi:hypothetical protein
MQVAVFPDGAPVLIQRPVALLTGRRSDPMDTVYPKEG